MGEDVVYVKLRLVGEPARIIREQKARGSYVSVRDVVVQGLLALERETVEREIRRSRVPRVEDDPVALGHQDLEAADVVAPLLARVNADSARSNAEPNSLRAVILPFHRRRRCIALIVLKRSSMSSASPGNPRRILESRSLIVWSSAPSLSHSSSFSSSHSVKI